MHEILFHAYEIVFRAHEIVFRAHEIVFRAHEIVFRARTRKQKKTKYCRSGNICEVLIFANFARMTNLRIQEFRENYYYDSTTKEKEKFAKIPKSDIRENLNTRIVPIYSK